MSDSNQWKIICSVDDIAPFMGVRALINEEQVAIFRVGEKFYAIDAVDPHTNQAVLSRGIVGDLQGKVVVTSPLYKQHFCLVSGQCLEDESVFVKVFSVRENNGVVELAA